MRYLWIVLLPLLLVSCGPVPMERLGTEYVSLSAENSETGSISAQSRSIRAADVINDDQFFKAERQEENRGELLHQLTPKTFVLDIDDIAVYNSLGTNAYISKRLLRSVNSPAGIIPQHYDLVHAYGIIRNAMIQNSTYEGISVQFLPQVGSSNDGFYVLSITGIELPEEYDGVKLQGEVTDIEGLPDGLRYFSFEYL